MDNKIVKRKSLINLFVIMFAIYALISLIMNTVYTYVVQNSSYHKQCEDNLRDINKYIASLIEREGNDFAELKDYMIEHSDEMLIPIDYDGEYDLKREEFDKLFKERYHDKIYGRDIHFDDLDEDIKLVYAEYTFEYWLTVFEEARDSFGLAYTYFIFPTEEPNMCYMIDAVREEKEVDGKTYLLLADVVEEDPAKYVRMWEAWHTGTEPNGFDVFNNEYGYSYAYYTPVYVNGVKIGLACAEINVDAVSSAILNRVYLQFIGAFLVLAIGILIMIALIKKKFLYRLINLEGSVEKYSDSKDVHVADEIRLKEKGNDEIRSLSDQFADMIVELKDYMTNLQHVTAEKERIGAELNVATQIQADMLPRVFPAFPNREEFDLYATMNPAKEVGGDFYDFFMVDDDHIALVMADVSGKGVPAALFMVIAKTLIKTRTQQGGLPGDILSEVNDTLCEGNDAELFVTVWLAIIEISTGKGWAANAGHEHPAIKRKGGDFELSIYKHSPAVATMEGIPFKQHEFELNPGDSLFVYTDGVAEATNSNNELYGNDRMINALNANKDVDLKEALANIRKDIDAFVGDAPQFDDITMLMFNYYGKDGKNAE